MACGMVLHPPSMLPVLVGVQALFAAGAMMSCLPQAHAGRLPLVGPLPTRAAKLVDRLEHRRDEGALLGRKLRAPDIENQHHAQLLRGIPCLVLDRVIEYH